MAFDTASVMALRQSIIQQNVALRTATSQGSIAGQLGDAPAPGADFVTAMRSALETVSANAQRADQASTAFAQGETTDIAAVMLARQQSSLGFEATLQARNKLLSAYKDIMGMPV